MILTTYPFEKQNSVLSNLSSLDNKHFMFVEYFCAQFWGKAHNVCTNLTVAMKDGCKVNPSAEFKLCELKSNQNTVLLHMH